MLIYHVGAVSQAMGNRAQVRQRSECERDLGSELLHPTS